MSKPIMGALGGPFGKVSVQEETEAEQLLKLLLQFEAVVAARAAALSAKDRLHQQHQQPSPQRQRSSRTRRNKKEFKGAFLWKWLKHTTYIRDQLCEEDPAEALDNIALDCAQRMKDADLITELSRDCFYDTVAFDTNVHYQFSYQLRVTALSRFFGNGRAGASSHIHGEKHGFLDKLGLLGKRRVYALLRQKELLLFPDDSMQSLKSVYSVDKFSFFVALDISYLHLFNASGPPIVAYACFRFEDDLKEWVTALLAAGLVPAKRHQIEALQGALSALSRQVADRRDTWIKESARSQSIKRVEQEEKGRAWQEEQDATKRKLELRQQEWRKKEMERQDRQRQRLIAEQAAQKENPPPPQQQQNGEGGAGGIRCDDADDGGSGGGGEGGRGQEDDNSTAADDYRAASSRERHHDAVEQQQHLLMPSADVSADRPPRYSTVVEGEGGAIIKGAGGGGDPYAARSGQKDQGNGGGEPDVPRLNKPRPARFRHMRYNQVALFKFIEHCREKQVIHGTYLWSVPQWVAANGLPLWEINASSLRTMSKRLVAYHQLIVVVRNLLRLMRLIVYDGSNYGGGVHETIHFSFPGFDEADFFVGRIAVLQVVKFFMQGSQGFDKSDWEKSETVASRELMLAIPDGAAMFRTDPDNARRIFSVHSSENLHNLFLASYLNLRAEEQELEANGMYDDEEEKGRVRSFKKMRKKPDKKKRTVSCHDVIKSVDAGSGNASHVASWKHRVYMYNPGPKRVAKLMDSFLRHLHERAKAQADSAVGGAGGSADVAVTGSSRAANNRTMNARTMNARAAVMAQQQGRRGGASRTMNPRLGGLGGVPTVEIVPGLHSNTFSQDFRGSVDRNNDTNAFAGAASQARGAVININKRVRKQGLDTPRETKQKVVMDHPLPVGDARSVMNQRILCDVSRFLKFIRVVLLYRVDMLRLLDASIDEWHKERQGTIGKAHLAVASLKDMVEADTTAVKELLAHMDAFEAATRTGKLVEEKEALSNRVVPTVKSQDGGGDRSAASEADHRLVQNRPAVPSGGVQRREDDEEEDDEDENNEEEGDESSRSGLDSTSGGYSSDSSSSSATPRSGSLAHPSSLGGSPVLDGGVGMAASLDFAGASSGGGAFLYNVGHQAEYLVDPSPPPTVQRTRTRSRTERHPGGGQRRDIYAADVGGGQERGMASPLRLHPEHLSSSGAYGSTRQLPDEGRNTSLHGGGEDEDTSDGEEMDEVVRVAPETTVLNVTAEGKVEEVVDLPSVQRKVFVNKPSNMTYSFRTLGSDSLSLWN